MTIRAWIEYDDHGVAWLVVEITGEGRTREVRVRMEPAPVM